MLSHGKSFKGVGNSTNGFFCSSYRHLFEPTTYDMNPS